MANQTGRPIAPARKLVAAVMGTIAVFVMALGLGMSNWGVVFFGLALLALSIALGMVNMVRRGARAWVAGTAEVRAVSPPPASASVYGRAEIQAVIVAPGLPTSEVTIREPRVPVVKWPIIGETLPVMVDVDDMRRVKINWDDATPREMGGDPPPPEPATYDDTADDLDNDLLGDVEPPPWATPEHPWGPPPPPPGGATSELPVVRDTPTGRIVEGEFVDHDAEPAASPLPHRAATTPGRRPSPRPRGGATTVTAEPDTEAPEDPGQTAPRTTNFMPAAAPPPQRTPSDDLPTDIPLDDPRPTDPHRPGHRPANPDLADPHRPGPRPANPDLADPDLADPDLADQAARPAAQRRPEPTPMSTTAAPAPTAPPPTAPEPVTPPPTAPEPATAGPSRPSSTTDPEIDLPLEADPVPTPETTPAAASALNDDLIAPPAAPTPATPLHVTEPTDVRESTRFSSNAAHEATVTTQQLHIPPTTPSAAEPTAPAEEPRTAVGPTGKPGSPVGEPAPIGEPAAPAGEPAAPVGEFRSRADTSDARAGESRSTRGEADRESVAEAAPPPAESKSHHTTGVLAGAAAAAAAAVAAVRKFGKSDKGDAPADPTTTPPSAEKPAGAEADRFEPSQPAATQPGTARSEPMPWQDTRPSTAHSEPMPPQDAQPSAAWSEPMPPQNAQASAARSEPTPPQDAQPSAAHSEPTPPQTPQPEAAPPQAAQPQAAQPEPAQPEPAQPEPAQPEPAQPEATKAPAAANTAPAAASTAAGAAAAGAAAGAAVAGTAASARPSTTSRADDRSPWADLATNVEPDERANDVITAYPTARPGAGGSIFGVGITVLVTDLARSIAFYRDTLGFFEIDHGDGSAVLASGDTRIVLRTVHDLSAEAGRLIYLNLEVGDVEAIYRDLLAKGVTFVHPPQPVNRGDRLELWSASFHDPDNHNIAITQWRAAA